MLPVLLTVAAQPGGTTVVPLYSEITDGPAYVFPVDIEERSYNMADMERPLNTAFDPIGAALSFIVRAGLVLGLWVSIDALSRRFTIST